MKRGWFILNRVFMSPSGEVIIETLGDYDEEVLRKIQKVVLDALEDLLDDEVDEG